MQSVRAGEGSTEKESVSSVYSLHAAPPGIDGASVVKAKPRLSPHISQGWARQAIIPLCKTVLHCSSLHTPPSLFFSPSISLALPWAPVPNLQGDYDKNERPQRDHTRRDKTERRGWQRERMRRRRRRKGLEMDDVTGNFGCALWFGLRVWEPAVHINLYLSKSLSRHHFQIIFRRKEASGGK